MYGKLPNTVTLPSKIDVSSMFKISSLIIVIWFLKMFLRYSARLLSFSITITFLGCLLRIRDVKFPVPGPTSKINLFLTLTIFTILFKIFLSVKKFYT